MNSFSLIFYLTFSSFLIVSFPSQALSDVSPSSFSIPVGIIKRARKQQIITYISPNSQENVVPFLTSPLGKYTAFIVRHGFPFGSNGHGNDFCYIQVEETETKKSMWESKCAPISNVNSCTLLFSKQGLYIYDGSKSVWDTDADSADYNFLVTLELLDEGDMRIHDKDGKLAWRASDLPRVKQHCGLKTVRSPFGQDGNLPRAADVGPAWQGGQVSGVSQAFGFSDQPLVDNRPYDSSYSGGCKGKCNWVGGFVGGLVGFVVMM